MGKPIEHAYSTVKKCGGTINDYLRIHQLMDSSKGILPDNRHRALFHHSFGILLLEKIFGVDTEGLNKLMRKYNLPEEAYADFLQWRNDCYNNGTVVINADGKKVSIRGIGEQHCLEDFKHHFIPSPQDYLVNMEYQAWMHGATNELPLSAQKTAEYKAKRDNTSKVALRAAKKNKQVPK